MSMKEIKRLYVLQKVEDEEITGEKLRQRLGLSLRQIRRLLAKKARRKGTGLIHGNRGRPGTMEWAKPYAKRQELAEEEYREYNDSSFTEELMDEYGLSLSRSTVRRIRRSIQDSQVPASIALPAIGAVENAKPRAGELLQTDGSRHDWLEGRGPWLTLVAYIDNATSEVLTRRGIPGRRRCHGLLSRAAEHLPATRHLRRQSMQTGIPSFKAQQGHHRAGINGEEPKSQFGRLADEFGIQLIAAQSPQAKGRVERLSGTLRDRLVKALGKARAAIKNKPTRC